jgi:hypothetical protein
MACGAIPESFESLNNSLSLQPKPWSGVAHRKRQSGLPVFLKNNTKPKPVWQEIVNFSSRPFRPSMGAFFAPSETLSDLINRIPIRPTPGASSTIF